MIRSKILNIAGLFIFLFLVSNQKISAQKIDSDSLLTVIIKDMQNEKNYEKNIQRALLGKENCSCVFRLLSAFRTQL